MTNHADLRFSLGSYLAGALDTTTRAELEAHLTGCDSCRSELAELSSLPGLLARLTPVELDDDLLRPPTTLLPGLLAQARAIEAAARRRLWRWRATAAGLGATAAAAAVMVLLPATAPDAPTGPSFPLRPTAASPGTTGQVTLVRKPWGTELALSMRGLPAGTACVAVMSGRDGHRETLGNWGPTPNHAAMVLVTTGVSVGGLATISVETTAGLPLLSAEVPA